MANFAQRERRLKILAADLAELKLRTAKQRINAAFKEAKQYRGPGRIDFLKSHQVDHAIILIGGGQSVLSVAQQLRCGVGTLYKAIAERASI